MCPRQYACKPSLFTSIPAATSTNAYAPRPSRAVRSLPHYHLPYPRLRRRKHLDLPRDHVEPARQTEDRDEGHGCFRQTLAGVVERDGGSKNAPTPRQRKARKRNNRSSKIVAVAVAGSREAERRARSARSTPTWQTFAPTPGTVISQRHYRDGTHADPTLVTVRTVAGCGALWPKGTRCLYLFDGSVR